MAIELHLFTIWNYQAITLLKYRPYHLLLFFFLDDNFLLYDGSEEALNTGFDIFLKILSLFVYS